MQTMGTPRSNGEPAGGAFLWMSVGAVALLALGLSVAGFFFPTRSPSSGSAKTNADAGPQRVSVKLGEFAVRPTRIEVAPGTDLTLVVANTGAMLHDLKVNGTAWDDAAEAGHVRGRAHRSDRR